MPEGPEVEAVRLDLQTLIEKSVSSSFVTKLALKYQRYIDQEDNMALLKGKTIKRIERKGKFIIFWFGEVTVVNHLGMTGGWIIQNSIDAEFSKYAKVILEFTDNSRAIFDDIRNFGRFQVFESEKDLLDQTESIKNLGIDGLESPFPQNEFNKLLELKRNRNKEIGSLLLDQRVVSGIGNIYKSESLFRAKINPLRIVNSLSEKETHKLGQSISEVLQDALSYGGSTIDTFQTPFGGKGKAQDWHQVYNRAENECSVCKSEIFRIVQKSRSTFFCPQCQKLPAGIRISDLAIPKKKKRKKTIKKKKKS